MAEVFPKRHAQQVATVATTPSTGSCQDGARQPAPMALNLALVEKGAAGAVMARTQHYIGAWREHLGLTQDSLAQKIGVTKGTISRWEAGKRDMGLADLVNVANALGVEPLALLRAPEDYDAAKAIDRFARLVDRVGAERAQKLLDALDDTM